VAAVTDVLFADAVRVLAGYDPPDPATAATRAEMLRLLELGPRVLRRDGCADHFTASTLIVDPARERVLLCLHRRIRRWVQVGGHCEAEDESLAGAALREATEESGIPGLRLVGEPIGLDIHPVNCSAGPSRHFDVRFAALAPPGARERVSDESEELAWFPYDGLPHPLASATATLVAPAVAAVRRTPSRPAP
jgi:8-oxo-dGTP pyrophosphatase MutT (NUDIX family)